MSFSQFIAIDWSGAKTGNYKGKIQVAVCKPGTAAPILYNPHGDWTRTTIASWLRDVVATSQPALIGMDFSFSAPFLDKQAFLPGLSRATTAREFWQEIDSRCEEPDFGAAAFLERHRGRYFYLGKADGTKSTFMRLRQCEISYIQNGGRKPSSVFDAIGAAQVAKASFAGMRVLHHVSPHIAVWPFDTSRSTGSRLVEIYCQAFIRHAGLKGLKLRSRDDLNIALKALGSRPVSDKVLGTLTDDKTDALASAAGMRRFAEDARFWQPAGLTTEIARTEGWTFGVL
jgi:hypothetical protein